MKRSQFRFLRQACPELYTFVTRAEFACASAPAAAMADLKAAGGWLALDMLKREDALREGSAPDDLIAELEALELLEPAFVVALRRLELADLRESELFFDAYAAKHLLLAMYDLSCWFYRTYIDDSYVPDPFYLAGADSARRGLTISEMDRSGEGGETVVDIDGDAHAADWTTDRIVEPHPKRDERGGVYSGERLGSWRHGKGTYVWEDGTKYEGSWVKDMEHGNGMKAYANGDRYTGQWREGFFHGKGLYEWADGSRHEGCWESGMEHGCGCKTYANGARRNGYWTYGELVNLTDQLQSLMIQSSKTWV